VPEDLAMFRATALLHAPFGGFGAERLRRSDEAGTEIALSRSTGAIPPLCSHRILRIHSIPRRKNMLAALTLDRFTVEEEPASHTPIITTLYDLIAALHAASTPGEEDLVTAAVVDLCHTGRLRFLALPHTPVIACAEGVCTRETIGVGAQSHLQLQPM
jgi:hypothetical protein